MNKLCLSPKLDPHTSLVSTIRATKSTLLTTCGLFQRSADDEYHQRNTEAGTVGGRQAVTTTTAPAVIGPRNVKSGETT